MKKVYTASVTTKAHIAKDLLADNGIAAVIQGEAMSLECVLKLK
jgi:hypothetical protein